MADEKTEHTNTSTGTSPQQRNEDVGDEEIPVASGRGPAQASNIPTGMSQKREANQHSSIAHQVQQYSNWDLTVNPSFDPFILESSHVSPSLGPILPVSPVPPQAQNAASLPSLPPNVDFLQTLSQTIAPFKPPIGHQVQQYSNWNVSENPSFDPFMLESSQVSLSLGPIPPVSPVPPQAQTHKREANQHSSIAHQVQQYSNCDLTVNPSFDPFILESSHVSPSLGPILPFSPVPPQAQTAASLPSLPPNVDFLQTLSQTIAPFKPPIGHQVQQYSNWNVSENPSFDPLMLESSQVSPSLGPIPPVSLFPPQPQTAAYHPSLSPTSAPFQSPVCTAPIPPQDQNDDSYLSLFETVEYLQTLSKASAPFQSPIQTASPVSHFAKKIPPVPMLQGSRRSGLAQASNASAGPFLKRYATQPPPTSVREVRSRIDLSVPTSAQPSPPLLAHTMPTAPDPPGAQTADFFSSISGYVDLSQTLYPTNAPPPSAAQTGGRGSRLPTATPPLRISPGESKCNICRMDIALHPMVSTLPCGHRFHGMCLNLTPVANRLLGSGLHPPCPVCRPAPQGDS